VIYDTLSITSIDVAATGIPIYQFVILLNDQNPQKIENIIYPNT